MVRISINSNCNNRCKYCIQKGKYQSLNLALTFEDIADILRWAKGDKTVTITGGEPTLHPDIVRILEKSNQNFPTFIYSNILCPTEILEEIHKIAPQTLWHINTTVDDDKRDLFKTNIELFKKNNIGFSLQVTLANDEESDNKTIDNAIETAKKYPELINRYHVILAKLYDAKENKIINHDKNLLKFFEKVKKETPYNSIFFECTVGLCELSLKTAAKAIEDYGVNQLHLAQRCITNICILADKSVQFCEYIPEGALLKKRYDEFDNYIDCTEYLNDIKHRYMQHGAYNCILNGKNCNNTICEGICFAHSLKILQSQRKTSISSTTKSAWE